MKASSIYSPLHVALQHRWTGLTKRQTKELNPAVVHVILGMNLHYFDFIQRDLIYLGDLALWEYQSNYEGKLPDDIDAAPKLEQIGNSILTTSDVNRQVLTSVPRDLIECAITEVACFGFEITNWFQYVVHISCARVLAYMRCCWRDVSTRHPESSRRSRSTDSELFHVRWKHGWWISVQDEHVTRLYV